MNAEDHRLDKDSFVTAQLVQPRKKRPKVAAEAPKEVMQGYVISSHHN